MASVAPRASGIASLVSDNDVTNPYSNPSRNTSRPTTPTTADRPAETMITSPIDERDQPGDRAAQFADPIGERGDGRAGEQFDAAEAHGDQSRCRSSRPRTQSSSQLPETTNTEIPASAISADPDTTSHAVAVSGGRR